VCPPRPQLVVHHSRAYECPRVAATDCIVVVVT
jgi:hypothetical protein